MIESTAKKIAIVLLGAPNDENGNLSQIALERCEKALEESQTNPNSLILPTGGFGAHFNTTDKPHAFYTRKWLVAQGVSETRFLRFAESGNTVADGRKAKPILLDADITDIIIVTSDFHARRALLCFKHALQGTNINISLSTAVTHLSKEELEKLAAHESKSIAWLEDRFAREAKGIFDITEFGARGDGKTDCTEAIQDALDDAAKCHGVVTVPPGTYMTGRLRMGKGVSLEGHSAWSFRSFGASIFTLNDASADCLIDITGAFGCSIRGMSLSGDMLGDNIHGVKLSWPVYNGGNEEDTPTIDDCRIGNFTGNGLHYEHVWCFSVRHSMICHNLGAGLYIDGWDGFIIDNWFSGNKNGGVTGGPCCASVTATGNRVEWNGIAGFMLPHVYRCNFTGNYFDRSFGPALIIGDDNGSADSISITGNMINRSGKPLDRPFKEEWDSSHIRLTHCDNINVSGNTFRLGRDDGDKGIFSPNYMIVIKDCENCIFSTNSWSKGSLKEGIILLGNNKDVITDGNQGYSEQPKP